MRAWAFLVATALSSSALGAPTKGECVDADTRGQSERIRGRLRAARVDFTTCASASCPDLVRNDCRERLTDVNRSMPSVVVSVPLTAGAFLTLDGASLPLDGAAVAVDPGEHELTLNVRGHAPITRHIVVKEGETHHEEFPLLVATEAPHHDRSTPAMSPLRIAGIVTGALGLVGLGIGSAFGVAGYGAWGAVQSECLAAASCDLSRAQADRSRAIDFATASDIAFVLSGVLVATGVTLFLVGHATVTVTRDDVALVFRGTF